MSTIVPGSAEVLAELRAFQRTTSTYAFSRLYDEDHPSLRFLVADEVGLGKTLVARGLIAQVVEHLQRLGDKRVDIVYICSNGAIARQNLRKLNIAGDDAIVQADRFTLLANEVHRLEKRPINLIAVTPGTSLEFGNSAGKFPERALLYAVLQRVWGKAAMQGSGPERLFYLGITDQHGARKRLSEEAKRAQPSASVVSAFQDQIRHLNDLRRDLDRPTLKVEFNRLAKTFTYKNSWTQQDRNQRNRFIVELRRALATVGIEALKPDLVILDEFQRFRTLLDPSNDSWASRLAHELFDYQEPESGRPTRTLLMSATPYRPYTTADEPDGDNHYEDFVHTVEFLLNDAVGADSLRTELKELRRSLLTLDRDGGAAAELACQTVANRLRPVMARTERLASTPDRNGMLGTVTVPVTLERADIDGYLAAAGAADLLGHQDVVEYWKSGPYLLNFMENYALKKAFDEAAGVTHAPPALSELVRSGRGLLGWDDVSAYERIDPANARLRALVDDTIGRDMWKLLWLPPALTYYSGDSAFDEGRARAFTKRLVFSAWHLVPKVISAMLSYEAERHIFHAADEAGLRSYDEFSDRPDRRLDFTMRDGAADRMSTLNLIVPFVELARLVDPLALAETVRAGGDEPTRERVEREAGEVLAAAMAPLLGRAGQGGNIDQRWYWAAPLLLDAASDAETAMQWWEQEAWPSSWTGAQADDDRQGGFFQHLQAAQDLLEDPAARPLGRVPEDLVEVLVATSLGSPAVCALRALSRVGGRHISFDPHLLNGAARLAWGFRSLFNGPDATAVVRAFAGSPSATGSRPTSGPEVYWRSALDYCVAGHLQAVLDEYIHVLKDWRGFLSDDGIDLVDLADTAANALSLRTVSYAADVPRADNGRISVDRHTMRGRFAIRFGDQAIEGEARQNRAEQASQAFNSPFWPFVLTTTSIGQEGLDFHLYSHAIVHWNLPSNPVDFEQREGRIHRYKGHAIRKNVATACGAAAFTDPSVDPWSAMFDAAVATGDADGEISPYWVFHPQCSTAHIERHVPVLPLSSDAAKLERLLDAVATYRLSFGQPRQEELLKYLAGRIPEDKLLEIVQRLRVDLTPPSSAHES